MSVGGFDCVPFAALHVAVVAGLLVVDCERVPARARAGGEWRPHASELVEVIGGRGAGGVLREVVLLHGLLDELGIQRRGSAETVLQSAHAMVRCVMAVVSVRRLPGG